MKLRSTTTGVEVGLRSDTKRPSELAVVPPAKYQWADVELWHGATPQPDELCTDWDTAIPPPATVTVSACQEPDDGLGKEGDTTLSPGTLTAACTTPPASLTAVMAAETGAGVVLVSTSAPGADPEAVLVPVQYQADDSASGALTDPLGVPDEPADAGAPPRVATATDTPAITATTTTRTRHRGSGL
jgi:hypothetical protein